MELICGKPTNYFKLPSSLSEISTEHYRRSKTNFGICRYWKLHPHHIDLIYPQMISGTIPEPFRKIHQNLIPDTIRNTYRYSYYFEDNSCTDRLQQGRLSVLFSSTYCTSRTSMTSEMWTVVRGAVSTTADEVTVSALNQRSRVSLTDFRRDTFSLGTTSNLQLRGQPLHQLLPKGQT